MSLPHQPHKTFKRSAPLARGGKLKRGKKTKAWEKVRRQKKVVLAALGVTVCEGGFAGCTRDNFLSLAHRLKRRNITTEDELKNCLLLCWSCHWHIERGGEERMQVMFDEILSRRAA